MKQSYILLLSLLVIGSSCSNRVLHKTAGSANLRILTYNVHHANPPSKPDSIDITAIANVIKKQNPDIVALQEIDVYTTRSGKTLHEANELARLTGMQAFFAKAIDYGGGEYGVAVLSKLPMEAMQSIALPTDESTRGEHRTLGKATISVAPGKKILFAFTHLDAQANPTNRLLQIKKITELLKDEKLPVIIAGDLNAIPRSEVINILDANFTRTCINGCGYTIPEKNPNKTIDFIAFRPSSAFSVVAHEVINEPYASDHLPVQAILRMN